MHMEAKKILMRAMRELKATQDKIEQWLVFEMELLGMPDEEMEEINEELVEVEGSIEEAIRHIESIFSSMRGKEDDRPFIRPPDTNL